MWLLLSAWRPLPIFELLKCKSISVVDRYYRLHIRLTNQIFKLILNLRLLLFQIFGWKRIAPTFRSNCGVNLLCIDLFMTRVRAYCSWSEFWIISLLQYINIIWELGCQCTVDHCCWPFSTLGCLWISCWIVWLHPTFAFILNSFL